MGRVFIADPALKDQRGHHFLLSLNISHTITERGDSVVWLTNKKNELLDKDIGSEITVVPTFSVGTYDRFIQSTSSSNKKIKRSFPKRIFKRLPGGLQRRLKKARNYVGEFFNYSGSG